MDGRTGPDEGGAYAYAGVTVDITTRVTPFLPAHRVAAGKTYRIYHFFVLEGGVSVAKNLAAVNGTGSFEINFLGSQTGYLERFSGLGHTSTFPPNGLFEGLIDLVAPFQTAEIRMRLAVSALLSIQENPPGYARVQSDFGRSVYWGGIYGVTDVETGVAIPLSEFQLTDEDGNDWAQSPPVLPALRFERAGSDVLLSWPKWASSSGFIPQTLTDLAQGNWTASTAPYQTNGLTLSLSWPTATEPARFFRLHRP